MASKTKPNHQEDLMRNNRKKEELYMQARPGQARQAPEIHLWVVFFPFFRIHFVRQVFYAWNFQRSIHTITKLTFNLWISDSLLHSRGSILIQTKASPQNLSCAFGTHYSISLRGAEVGEDELSLRHSTPSAPSPTVSQTRTNTNNHCTRFHLRQFTFNGGAVWTTFRAVHGTPSASQRNI